MRVQSRQLPGWLAQPSRVGALMLVAALAVSCGGASIGGGVACADLTAFTAPNVRIVSAEDLLEPTPMTHPFTGQPLSPLPPHCFVAGVIDDAINFELRLPRPEAWNGRFAMGGGGGFVGAVQNTLLLPQLTSPSALEAGYATVGTDTGHQGSRIDASWALDNDIAERNFADRAVHVVTEVSKQITEQHYGRPIAYSYFAGCSRGGGQAMIASQRYPDDFDGIIAAAPAMNWTALGAGFLQNQRAMYPDPGQLATPVVTPENRALLEREILAQCDAIDGVEDGVLTDPRQCRFDPSTLPRCRGGAGADCLTAAQLAAIQTIYHGPVVAGESVFPGIPVGAENVPFGWDFWITGGTAFTQEGSPNAQFAFGTQLYKYFVFDDPSFDYSKYDFANWRQDTAPTARLLNATNTNMAPFRDSGGKIIYWHGWSDAALTALATIDYYETMRRETAGADEFSRLYMLPGVAHCEGGPGPDRVDWLALIANWVERGQAPDRVVAAKVQPDGSTASTRPLCPYPMVARYDGQGNANDAASFSCAAP